MKTVIHFFYLLDTPYEVVMARLQSAYGEGIVNSETVQRWTSKFRNRKIDPDDEWRRGRP
jgi:hypothetical protein